MATLLGQLVDLPKSGETLFSRSIRSGKVLFVSHSLAGTRGVEPNRPGDCDQGKRSARIHAYDLW
jgi:hypothetical protein